jgi:hypothetical protein
MIATHFRFAFAAAFAVSLAVAPASAAPEVAPRTAVAQPAAKKISSTQPRQVRRERIAVREAAVRPAEGSCLVGCRSRLTLVGAGFGF